MTRGQQLAVAATALLGMTAGLGLYTFGYARGYSYLTNDPGQCANCHIMGEHFSAWIKASHRSVATCNDCHTPHNLVGKYMVKARNGFWHSFYFTRGGFHEPIQILPRDRAITEAACRHCHEDIVLAIDTRRDESSTLSCLRCHRDVGHLH